jgi:hypothetical protein
MNWGQPVAVSAATAASRAVAASEALLAFSTKMVSPPTSSASDSSAHQGTKDRQWPQRLRSNGGAGGEGGWRGLAGRHAKKQIAASWCPGAHLSRLRILDGGLASEDLRGRRGKGVNATRSRRPAPTQRSTATPVCGPFSQLPLKACIAKQTGHWRPDCNDANAANAISQTKPLVSKARLPPPSACAQPPLPPPLPAAAHRDLEGDFSPGRVGAPATEDASRRSASGV